jgi:hypothetical protein
VTSVVGLVFLPGGSVVMVITPHCPLCSLLKSVRPERFPDKERAAPHVPSSSLFSSEGCAFDVYCFISEVADPFKMSRHSLSATRWNLNYSLHDRQSERLPDGLVEWLSLPRRSCCFMPRPFIPMLHSGPFPSSLLDRLTCMIASLTPYRSCTAVICLRATANFFREPPSRGSVSSAVGGALRLDAGPHIGLKSARIVSTAAPSLGSSCCSAMKSDFSRLASISVVSILFNPSSITPRTLPGRPSSSLGCSSPLLDRSSSLLPRPSSLSPGLHFF